MAYNDATGVYTTASGSTTAAPGQTIASATWNAIFTDIAANMRPASTYMLTIAGVNFNATADTTFTILLPPGYTNYMVNNLIVSGASASLSTAKVGLFTAASGGGTAIVTASTAMTITTGTAGSNNSLQTFTINNQSTEMFANSSLFFRVSTVEGSAATATVTLEYRPVS